MVQADYEPLNKVIGKGKYGKVALVRSAKTREILVMTAFELNNMPDRTVITIATNKADVLKELVHPFLLRFHDSFFGEENEDAANTFFMITEYCENGTVGSKLAEQKAKNAGPLPDASTLKWGAQLLSAVHYLHKSKIIHGDIKPESLHINHHNDLKLGDLSTMKSSSVIGSSDEAIGGTPAYMAPEKIEGQVTIVSDEWSVGACLFHMATLHTPFGDTFSEIVSNLRENRLSVSMTTIKSRDLGDVISKLLVSEPSSRTPALTILQRTPLLRKYLPTMKYTMNEELGRGSFGIVYKVTENITNEIFVMKRIAKSTIDTKEFTEAKKEIVALEAFKHPFVVGHHESFEDKIGYCIIMEYCGGGTLGTEVKARKNAGTVFPDEQILKWGGQLMSAVTYIHDKGVMHRDIKPDNVLLSATKDVKLGDFGGVKIAANGGRAETVTGTPNYMAPDMIAACFPPFLAYTEVIDEWSSGVVIFELATFRVPIIARHLGDMFHKLQKKAFDVPISEITSDTIRGLVEKLLVFDPEQRVKAKDMVLQFENALLAGLSNLPKTVTLAPSSQVLQLEQLEPENVYEQLVELAANGTFGRCSAVRDRSTGCIYAMKLRPSALMMADTRKAVMVREEVTKMARLCAHRNIINYKKHFEKSEVLSMAAQLNGALFFLHEYKIVHKDVTAVNIFIKDRSNVLKLGHSGLAIEQIGVPGLVKSYPDKVAYLAPEIVSNPKSACWKVTTDMWALGCVLHEICTLRRTFPDTVGSLLVEKIKKLQYSALPAGKYSSTISNLVAGLLQKDPSKRKSSQEMASVPELLQSSPLTLAK